MVDDDSSVSCVREWWGFSFVEAYMYALMGQEQMMR